MSAYVILTLSNVLYCFHCQQWNTDSCSIIIWQNKLDSLFSTYLFTLMNYFFHLSRWLIFIIFPPQFLWGYREHVPLFTLLMGKFRGRICYLSLHRPSKVSFLTGWLIQLWKLDIYSAEIITYKELFSWLLKNEIVHNSAYWNG